MGWTTWRGSFFPLLCTFVQLAFGALHRGEQELGDVLYLDGLAGRAVGLLRGQAVGEHHPAERAAGGDLVGAGLDRLGGPVEVDPAADLLLHPHPRAAGAAAERLGLVPRHLGVLRTRDDLEQLAWSVVHLVVPAEVARVVVGDLLAVE